MNRRNFIKFLGAASVGATVAYSFPSIIVPKNIEVYPDIVNDLFFQESSWESYLRGQQAIFDMIDNDLNDALRMAFNALDKQLYENPVNVALFDKFGKPDFINNVRPSSNI